VDGVIARLQEQIRESRAAASVLGAAEDIDPGEAQRLLAHPLPHWVERMTVCYLKTHGGRAEKTRQGWSLTWPNGQIYTNALFTSKEAEKLPASRHLTLEDPKVRNLAMQLPRFAPGQPIPVMLIPGIAHEIQGVWSLWRVAIAAATLPAWPPSWNRQRIMPLFLADNGKVYVPTARHIWDQLLVTSPEVRSTLDGAASQAIFVALQKAAEDHGKILYETLVRERQASIAREREKAGYSFATRRKAIERIGLLQVRNHRLDLLAQEEHSFREQLDQKAQVYPDLAPLLVIRVEGDGDE
jgi:hypothetical protein